jgi:hypothetical protein
LSTLSETSSLDAALQRMSQAASSDDGYRAQLVNLSSSYGGIYRSALDALYAGEQETLGAEQAFARVARDRQLLAETRERDLTRRRKRLVMLARKRNDMYAEALAELQD